MMRRFPRQHMSSVKLADETVWSLAPFGWGTVRATEDGDEIARIIRRSWWGRRWEILAPGFRVDLVSRPRPRRWALTIGDEPIAEVRGSALGYNKLVVDASIAVPTVAVILAWQVIVRPWESARYPVVLLPERAQSRPIADELPRAEPA